MGCLFELILATLNGLAFIGKSLARIPHTQLLRSTGNIESEIYLDAENSLSMSIDIYIPAELTYLP